jgi:hypothetical protein
MEIWGMRGGMMMKERLRWTAKTRPRRRNGWECTIYLRLSRTCHSIRTIATKLQPPKQAAPPQPPQPPQPSEPPHPPVA